MRLELLLSPNKLVIEDATSDAIYPWLLPVGRLVIAARAGSPTGLGATESSNMTVRIDNTNRQFTRITRRPLRVRADVYDNDGNLAFEGVVSNVELGNIVTLEIA